MIFSCSRQPEISKDENLWKLCIEFNLCIYYKNWFYANKKFSEDSVKNVSGSLCIIGILVILLSAVC